MEVLAELMPASRARNVISTRTDTSSSTTGRTRALWFTAGAAVAAVTGGLLAALYIAFVIGWSLEGRAPASGWFGIGMGVIVGGIVGGIAIGIQTRTSIPRPVAPLIALVLLMLLGIIAWMVLTPLDSNGSLRYGSAVAAPFVTIAVFLGTATVALTKPALWLPVAGVASILIVVSLVIGLLAGG
jgi:hypothetical protein